MALVAAYILKSGTAELSPGGTTSYEFDFGGLPNRAQVPEGVVGFMVTDNSPGLQVQAILNDGPVIWKYSNLTGSAPGPKLFFQQVGFNGLKAAPAHNKITFEIVGGTGSMNINEIVLWYHLNV
jgi:hypothetical protein